MALVLGIDDGSRVFLVTRCGDVAEIVVRQNDSGKLSMVIDAPDSVIVKRGELAPDWKAESVERRIERVFGVQSVELIGVDFDIETLEVEHGHGATRDVLLVDRAELWPCEATGERCEHRCPQGRCYRMGRGRRA